MSELYLIYNDLLTEYYKLLEKKDDNNKKKISLNETDIDNYVNTFCTKLKNEKSMFKYLIEKDNRLFKGLKCTLIPKIKMEVILYIDKKTSDDIKLLIDNIWTKIWLIYLLGEAKSDEPNKTYMSKIAYLLNNNNNDNNYNNDNNDNNNKNIEMNMFKDINVDKLKDVFEKMNSKIDLNNMKDLIDKDGNVSIDSIKKIFDNSMDLNKLKDLIGNNNIKEFLENLDLKDIITNKDSDRGDIFINEILNDIKDKFKLDYTEDKINSKQFVDKIFDVGNTLGDTYSKKLKEGELSIGDIIGGVTNLVSNKNNNSFDEISKTIDIEKIDVKEVFEEFKDKLNNKIPKEMQDIINSINGDNLKNINIGSLVSSIISNSSSSSSNKIEELTNEQKQELIKFYENLEI